MSKPPFESRKAMERFVLESLDDIVSLLRVLDHPQRMRILAAMLSESKTFQELTEFTGLQKSALGNHLSVLQDKNLIEKMDRGLYKLSVDGESLFEHIAHSYLENKVREQERLAKIQTIGKREKRQLGN